MAAVVARTARNVDHDGGGLFIHLLAASPAQPAPSPACWRLRLRTVRALHVPHSFTRRRLGGPAPPPWLAASRVVQGRTRPRTSVR